MIRPIWAVPEPLLLPWEEDSWSLLQEGERVVLRYGQYAGMEFEPGMLQTIMPQLLQEQTVEQGPMVRIWGTGDQSSLVEILESMGCRFELMPPLESRLMLFSQMPGKRPELDLLQGMQWSTEANVSTAPGGLLLRCCCWHW